MIWSFIAPTPSLAVTQAVRALFKSGTTRSARGLATIELQNVTIAFPHSIESTFLAAVRDGVTMREPSPSYLADELHLYATGSRDAASFGKASRFWREIQEPDGTVQSAYGHILFAEANQHEVSEWQWAYDRLRRDPDTRQAVMTILQPRHKRPGTRDVPCTMNIAFNLTHGRLDMNVLMRSNDLHFGLAYDLPFFKALHTSMARLLDRRPGFVFYSTLSLHVYERHWDIYRDSIMVPDPYGPPSVHAPLVDENGHPTGEGALWDWIRQHGRRIE